MATHLVQISADFRTKIENFYVFFLASGTLVLRLRALGNLKMGQVIHKIGLSKLYAAIFEIFIVWPVRPDFRQKMAKFAKICLKIGPYEPKMKISKIAAYSLETPILWITWPILRFSSAPNLKTNVADQKIGNVKMFDFGPKSTQIFIKTPAILKKMEVFKIPFACT